MYKHYSIVLRDYQEDLNQKWFLELYFTDPVTNQTIRRQIRGYINKGTTARERRQIARITKEELIKKLDNGWSPVSEELVFYNFSQALDYALTKCVVSKRTIQGYRSCIKQIKSGAEKLGIDLLHVRMISRRHIKLILDKCRELHNWSNHAYNKYLGYLSALFSRLEEYEVIKSNPVSKIKTLPLVETDKFLTLDDWEKRKLRTELTRIHPNFFTFLMVIYHTGMRPNEVRCLKIRDLNMERRVIMIYPDLEERNSKTNNIRVVPINNHLYELLQNHIAGHENDDLYLFGPPKDSYVIQYGVHVKKQYKCSHKMYFGVSDKRIKRDTATKLWKSLVMDNLGIKKHMYALKHTGADDKILAGVPLDALKTMYGHTSKRMTEKYARKVKEVYQKQIVDGSPDF
ncbi:tyrosine-type recombinase/integrase [Terrimonas rubra]|uniref:Tyrosine-type recombinase/integrase n=1 Tax=Terrimonas rubra TaxID=1035890 RepID=A0ABW6A9X6_9BACT